MAETESNSITSKSTNKPAPGRYLLPFAFEVSGDTGYCTWHCRIEEVDEQGNVMQGPIQLHGIDTPGLNRHHGGKHINFLLNHVKPKMLKHFEDHKQDHSEGMELKGKRL